MDIINDEDWLCLFTNDNEPRFFCPLHLRCVQNSQYKWLTVFYDSDNPDTQTSLHALNKYYEDMSTPQPLPKPGYEDTILAILTSEDTKRAGLIPPTRTVCTFSASNSTMTEKCTD